MLIFLVLLSCFYFYYKDFEGDCQTVMLENISKCWVLFYNKNDRNFRPDHLLSTVLSQYRSVSVFNICIFKTGDQRLSGIDRCQYIDPRLNSVSSDDKSVSGVLCPLRRNVDDQIDFVS